jgi:hypothetical protein
MSQRVSYSSDALLTEPPNIGEPSIVSRSLQLFERIDAELLVKPSRKYFSDAGHRS